MPGWKRNGWKTSTGQPVKNKDDFVQLDKLLCDRTITVKWVGINITNKVSLSSANDTNLFAFIPEIRRSSQRYHRE